MFGVVFKCLERDLSYVATTLDNLSVRYIQSERLRGAGGGQPAGGRDTLRAGKHAISWVRLVKLVSRAREDPAAESC